MPTTIATSTTSSSSAGANIAPTTISSNSNSNSSSGIRHLRAQGAFLYKRSTAQHLSLVAAKEDVAADAAGDRVTEAFGVENWPHLMHLLKEGDGALRRRVLVALADVFRQPQQLVMCIKFGALELIEHGVLDDSDDVQELSARVLSVAAASPCGRAEIMKTDIAANVLQVFAPAANKRTCEHLYSAMLSLARSFVGAQQLTSAGYLPAVLEHLKRALSEELELRALQLLKLLLNDGVDATVYRALEMDAMELSARRLFDSSMEMRVAACDVLGAMGYVDKAKRAAVDKGVVKKLCSLLADAKWQVTAASAGALMSIAVLDDAKRAVVAADGVQSVSQLLQSPKFLVQLNALKLVTVLAAYPPARRAFDVGATEYQLRQFFSDPDPLIARSAKLALQVVQWKA